MNRSYLLSLDIKTGLVLGALSMVLLQAQSANATQPLQDFLAAARSSSFQAREQATTVRQRESEKDAALGRLLPSLTARGSFTHNQYESSIPAGLFPGQTQPIVITPQNQADAVLQLDVPLLDLASHARNSQAEQLVEAAQLQQELIGTTLDRSVTRAYYSFVGTYALLRAAQASVDVAQKNVDFVRTRRELGAATDLDLQRALANLERARQDLSEASLAGKLTARQLETLTGIEPTPVEEFPQDSLQPEAPLEFWLSSQNTAQDRLQVKLGDIAEAGERAAKYALLPTLSANAQERITNATGFSGHSAAYALQAVLTWRLDYASYANAQAQSTALQVQQVRTEQARRAVEDEIFEAFQRVDAGIAKSTSARAQVAATQRAAELAVERYQAGAATQLDVTQSQRDAYLAQAALIQADADLTYSRALLRIASGRPPAEHPAQPPLSAAPAVVLPGTPLPR